MSQLRDRMVSAEAMVRSRAWREGYAAFRRGDPARFLDRGSKALAYEYGRLTAAWLIGEDRPVPWISDRRPLPEHLVPVMAEALLNCAIASAVRSPCDEPEAVGHSVFPAAEPAIGTYATGARSHP